MYLKQILAGQVNELVKTRDSMLEMIIGSSDYFESYCKNNFLPGFHKSSHVTGYMMVMRLVVIKPQHFIWIIVLIGTAKIDVIIMMCKKGHDFQQFQPSKFTFSSTLIIQILL